MSPNTVAEVLFEKFAKFYHAANLREVQTYCNRSALLARSELASAANGFTPFYSDESDKKRGVWERVFGNLQDFNSLFWAADGCVPNAYGPITMVFGRTVWRATNDIAVTRENAAAKNYSLAVCRMEADSVAACFVKQEKWWQLKCNGLEASLGVSSIPFDSIDRIIVEPVAHDFEASVRKAFESAGGDGRKVAVRTVGKGKLRSDRLKVFEDLICWSLRLSGKVPQPRDLRASVPASLKSWIDTLPEPRLAPLRQWLEYTYIGSLSVK